MGNNSFAADWTDHLQHSKTLSGLYGSRLVSYTLLTVQQMQLERLILVIQRFSIFEHSFQNFNLGGTIVLLPTMVCLLCSLNMKWVFKCWRNLKEYYVLVFCWLNLFFSKIQYLNQVILIKSWVVYKNLFVKLSVALFE